MGRSKPVRRKYVKNYKRIFMVGNISLGLIVVVFMFITATLFLLQSNRIAVKGYEINELEKKIDELRETNNKLKTESVKLQSISLIQEKIDNLKMVPVNQINYVTEKTGVAMR